MTWISRLFGSTPDEGKTPPAVRSVYDDKSVEEQFENLNIDDTYSKFSDFVQQCWKDELAGTLNESSCYVTRENGFRGIAIKPLPKSPTMLYQYYCKQLAMKHKQLGYVLKLSEYQKKAGTELMKYYLKPSIKLQNQVKAEQLFGNVTIELHVKDGVAQKLSAVTSYYSDVNFDQVRDFEEWINVVFLNEAFNL